jgi:hypothetical protein
MPIFSGSRYVGMDFTALQGDDRKIRRFMHLRIPPVTVGSFQMTLRSDDTFDVVALRYGGQARLWFKLAEANALEFPLDTPVGTMLAIPF